MLSTQSQHDANLHRLTALDAEEAEAAEPEAGGGDAVAGGGVAASCTAAATAVTTVSSGKQRADAAVSRPFSSPAE